MTQSGMNIYPEPTEAEIPIPNPYREIADIDWRTEKMGFTVPNRQPDIITPSCVIWRNRTDDGALDLKNKGTCVVNRIQLGVFPDPEPYREIANIQWANEPMLLNVSPSRPPDEILPNGELRWLNRAVLEPEKVGDYLIVYKSVLGIF